MPAIASLFQNTFRKRTSKPSQALIDYLRDLFLAHPWRDDAIASRAFVDHGRVIGFIGLVPLRMVWRGQAVRAAVAVASMVENPKAHPTVGARLVRAVLQGPQDLTLSESASPLSRRLWEQLRTASDPAYNMDWMKVLRPAAFPLAFAAHKTRGPRWLQRMAAPADWLLARPGQDTAPAALGRGLAGRDATATEIADAIPQFLPAYRLRPDWDSPTLRWMLRHAEVKEHYGTLAGRLVFDLRGRCVGASLYYRGGRGLGLVLQMLAQPDATAAVLADLCANARQNGVAALKGRAQPEFLDSLLRARCLFWNGGSTLAHSTNSEMIADFKSGQALVTGLAGESWTRLIGGEFRN